MTNSRVISRAGRGSIFPCQLASLLELRKSARANRFGGLAQLLVGSISLAGLYSAVAQSCLGGRLGVSCNWICVKPVLPEWCAVKRRV
jgi:hypothetical protein